MTESLASTTSPETPTKVTGAPEGLQPQVLDELVNYRKEIDRQFDDQQDKSDYRGFKAQKLAELLSENGIVDDESDEVAHTDYAFATAIYQEVINTRVEDWANSDRRNQIANALEVYYADETAAASESETDDASDKADTAEAKRLEELQAKSDHNNPGEDVESEIETVDGYFNDMRATYAELLAERSKKMGLFERKTSVDAIETAKEEYAELVRACATELMLNMLTDNKSKQDITDTIDAFILEEVDYFINDLEQKRATDFTKRSKLVRAGLEKWTSWGPRDGATFKEKVFSKGNVKKGVVYAGLGLGVGAVAAPLVGLVGGGLAVAGTAAYLSKKIARNLVGARLDAAANSESIAKLQADYLRNAVASDDERLQSGDITKDIFELANERSNDYRKRNRRRLVGGMAISLVAGGAAAGLMSTAVETGAFGKIGDWAGDVKDRYFPGDNSDAHPGAGPDAGLDTDASVVAPGSEFEPDGGDGGMSDLSPRDNLLDGHLGSRELTPAGHEALAKQFNGYKVKSGDTVWDLSEKFLQQQGVKHPTRFEIDATKDAMLGELRATNSVDARGWLSVGDKLRIK